MRTLGIIPARGGSKGIPRKNLLPLLGRPLLAYTIDSAHKSRRLSRTILSSDDAEIIDTARALGVDVPFVRPADISGDHVPSSAVVKHALRAVEAAENREYDAVALLEPTSPLRMADDIDRALEQLEATNVDAVVSVCKVDAPHPMKMQVIVDGCLRPFMPQWWSEGLTRQQLPPVYSLTGTIYAVRAAIARESGSLWGARTGALVMPPQRALNIDSAIDVAVAEVLLRSTR